jgi:hypothetical protein
VNKLLTTVAIAASLLAQVAAGAPARAIVLPPGGVGVVKLNPWIVNLVPLDDLKGFNDEIIVGRAKGVAVAYVNGQVVPLIGLPGYTNIVPTGVSSNGYIVGYATSGTYVRGLFWSSYTSVPLDMGGTLGPSTYPQAVNSQGVAVGYVIPPAVTGFPEVAFEWSVSSGMRSIQPYAGTAAAAGSLSEALAISDSGYIAGSVSFPNGARAAVRWYPSGSGPINCGALWCGQVASGSYASGVLDNGTVYNETYAYPLSGAAQTIYPCPTCVVYAMSDVGRKVGGTFAEQAWTTEPASSSVEYLPVPSGVVSSAAGLVNGCGVIIGSVTYSNGATSAISWRKSSCDAPGTLL